DHRSAARGRADAAIGDVMEHQSQTSLAGARFVDPKVLARIGTLDLLAKVVVDGFINGLHRSPYFGASVDFAAQRGYMPGDGILVIVSDLYEDPDAVMDAIKPLRYRGNDLIVFHLLDPAEIDFNFSDASSFQDLETGEQIPVVPSALAEQYRSLVQEHIAALATR